MPYNSKDYKTLGYTTFRGRLLALQGSAIGSGSCRYCCVESLCDDDDPDTHVLDCIAMVGTAQDPEYRDIFYRYVNRREDD